MKAVINVEFFISVLVFLGTIFFLITSITNNIPQFHESSLLSSVRSKSFAISEVLLLDEGAPRNWNDGNVQRIGLSAGEKYVLSLRKINELKGMCSSNYGRVRDIVAGDSSVVVTINVTDIETGAAYLYCGPPVETLVLPKPLIKRFGVLEDGKRVGIEVGVI